MAVQPLTTSLLYTPQSTGTPALGPSTRTPAVSSPSMGSAPAYSVTISEAARAAGAAHTPASAPGTHAAAPSTSARAVPTTTSGYVMKVRAVLARGGNLSVSQIMASLGIPSSEQQQVAAALGATPKSA